MNTPTNFFNGLSKVLGAILGLFTIWFIADQFRVGTKVTNFLKEVNTK